MKKYDSIVNNDIMKYFVGVKGKTLMNHAANSCNVENALAVASVFCPEILEVKDYVFISEFYNYNIDSLEETFSYDRKKIEMFVNSWSLADFFLQGDDTFRIDDVIDDFGRVVKYFWEIRFKQLFPNKNIIVETGFEIMGEQGLTITVYQD